LLDRPLLLVALVGMTNPVVSGVNFLLVVVTDVLINTF